jgi:hypothetical protein
VIEVLFGIATALQDGVARQVRIATGDDAEGLAGRVGVDST